MSELLCSYSTRGPDRVEATTMVWLATILLGGCAALGYGFIGAWRRVRDLEGLLAVREVFDQAEREADVDAALVNYRATARAQFQERADAYATVRTTTLESIAWNSDAAATDALTGLLNRRALHERATAVQSCESVYSVAIADLDHFKALNDTFGHETGDAAIVAFARALTQATVGRDVVCRLGGEEFVVMFPGVTQGHAREAMERVRAFYKAEVAQLGLPKSTASFGVAESTMATDFDSVLRIADQALLRAKRTGRDQIISATRPGKYREIVRVPASV